MKIKKLQQWRVPISVHVQEVLMAEFIASITHYIDIAYCCRTVSNYPLSPAFVKVVWKMFDSQLQNRITALQP